ncbi:MAG TPA: tripartite tricarboxylate transporter substrate binding protein [Casimicrobiaceae bacterium]|jgi:tripartite-type tricarboxylate transporter receptor subunit TctC
MLRTLVTVLVTGALASAAIAAGDDFPSRPIKIIVPFSAGGAVDGPTRVIADALARRLGQPVYIENKPGAGATIGSELVARAAPDGYTLLLASQTNAISATMYAKLAYDPIEDFAPISLIGREQGVLAVNPAMPVASVQEFVAYVKARPGQVDFASSGNGSGQHLFVAMLASMAGLRMNHVPYRGSAPAISDVVGGRVPVIMPGLASVTGLIRSGKLRALAVTGTSRSPQMPDVPTLAESGFPGYAAYVWMGLLAPKGTPPATLDTLYRAVSAALQEPQVREYMAHASIEVVGSTPAEFDRYFHEERARWATVIRDTGAHID